MSDFSLHPYDLTFPWVIGGSKQIQLIVSVQYGGFLSQFLLHEENKSHTSSSLSTSQRRYLEILQKLSPFSLLIIEVFIISRACLYSVISFLQIYTLAFKRVIHLNFIHLDFGRREDLSVIRIYCCHLLCSISM